MPSHATVSKEEASAANREAFRGAAVGAAKWGLIAGGLGFAGFYLSPIYRNLTIQFKVYIQLSGMTFGGMIEADRRIRALEFRQRRERKKGHDEAVWGKWESLVEEEERLQRREMERKGRGRGG